jgi:hypothetical protein
MLQDAQVWREVHHCFTVLQHGSFKRAALCLSAVLSTFDGRLLHGLVQYCISCSSHQLAVKRCSHMLN